MALVLNSDRKRSNVHDFDRFFAIAKWLWALRATVTCNADGDRLAIGRELDGIAEKVANDMHKAVNIADHVGRGVGRDLRDQRKFFLDSSSPES